jgi:hypothetical protein
MAARRWLAVAVTVALVTPLAFVAGLAADDHANPPAHAAEYGGSGEFHPVVTRRLVDTRQPRSSGTLISGARQFNSTTNLKVAGSVAMGGGAAPVPSAGVQSVLLNITSLNGTLVGNVAVYATGRPAPAVAHLAVRPGRTNSNLVLVPLGSGGQVSLVVRTAATTARAGAVHLLVEVAGWFGVTSAPRGARLSPLSAARIVDTRTGVGGRSGALGQGQSMAVRIRGADSSAPRITDVVPNSAAVVGVLLSVTAIRPTANTWLTAQPPGSSSAASFSAPVAGAIVTSVVAVPVGGDGTIRITNARGSVNLTADVVGYFVMVAASTSRNGRVLPLSAPFTAIDTQAAGSVGKLSGGTPETWDFTPFVNSVTASGAAAGRQAGLWINLVARNLTFPYSIGRTSTWFTAYSPSVPAPSTTLMTLPRGDVIATSFVSRYGASNRLSIYNGVAFADYAVYVLGVVLAD